MILLRDSCDGLATAENEKSEEANRDVRERINKAESIIKKFCGNVAIG